MSATRRHFLGLLGAFTALPLLPSPSKAGNAGPGGAGSSAASRADLIVVARTDERIALVRGGRIVASTRLAGKSGSLTDGLYVLTGGHTRKGAPERRGLALALTTDDEPDDFLAMSVPGAFLADGPAADVAAGTPLAVVDRLRLTREVLAVSRLPAWPGAVAVAGWRSVVRGKSAGSTAARLHPSAVGAGLTVLVSGSERRIRLLRRGEVVATVATALRNPRLPLVASAHMLMSSLREGAGADWMHLASAAEAPTLAAQLARLEPLDRPAMAALWQEVGPGTVLIITDEPEDLSVAPRPLLVARVEPAAVVETAPESPASHRQKPRSTVRPGRQRRARRPAPQPAAPAREPFPPTRERYPGASTVYEFG